jgi:hypothetical protein
VLQGVGHFAPLCGAAALVGGDGQNFDAAIGSEFGSVQLAEMAALRAASYMLEEATDAAQLEDRYFEITDRHGARQCVVPLGSIIPAKAS